MKFRAAYLFLGLALLALSLFGTGCSTTESENNSVRPWDSPAGWENSMGGLGNMQHQ
jgi:hypothetical protein